MKALTSLLLCLLTASSAYAGLCSHSEEDIQNAQKRLEVAQTRFSGGTAGMYDVLFAEKQLIELKACSNGSDAASFQALSENALKRLTLARNMTNAGMADVEDLFLIQAEVVGLAQMCPDLIKTFGNRVASGVTSTLDLAKIQNACKALSRN